MINVTLVPVLSDNYSYIIEEDGVVAVVDPGQPGPVEKVLDEKGLKPAYILNTHHHSDHIAGNARLKEKYGAKIIGPASEERRIPDMDRGLHEGDDFKITNENIRILETPGHTSGHICFYFEDSKILFSGDTLFSMGCGRLFEGDAAQMWQSLEKIKSLPDETEIYCGHEYTQDNGKFCLSIEQDNLDLKERMEDVRKLRANNLPTIPTTLAQEKKTNVFLRAPDSAVFADYRQKKDSF